MGGWESQYVKDKNGKSIRYDLRKLSVTAFRTENIFDLIYERYLNGMKFTEVTVVPAGEDFFLLMAHRSTDVQPAIAEELLDPSCAIAH